VVGAAPRPVWREPFDVIAFPGGQERETPVATLRSALGHLQI
jgi:hypothetical protein